MASANPDPPPSLKPVKPYLTVARDVESSQPVVSYYMRFFALQKALEIDKKSPEARTFIAQVMGALESFKASHSEEGIRSEMVGQSVVESYALMLFKRADEMDRAAQFSSNLVKLFYTASLIFESLSQFGSVSEDIDKVRKYAKWKAAYLTACLKSGETPMAGPPLDNPEYASISAAYISGGSSKDANFDDPALAPPVPKSSAFPPELPSVPKGPPAASYPSTNPASSTPAVHTSGGSTAANLSMDLYAKAMKHCKFATNALQYEDSATAILYLEKALHLLRTGNDS